jgi:hypothetical protein
MGNEDTNPAADLARLATPERFSSPGQPRS